ncbi:MAG: OmpA family protein [Thiomonas sp.]|uniref:OmpA/MotB n=1 Tax=mine drainage metagenome TaxID=410659 RepID=E6PLX0_9ZZZZ
MRLMRVTALTGLLCLEGLAFQVVHADGLPNLYGIGGIGHSRASIDDPRIISGLKASGFGVNGINNSQGDTAYNLFLGYRFNHYFALEGGYFNLGEFGYNASTNPAGTLSGNAKFSGLALDAVGLWPITPRMTLLGFIGGQYTRTQDSFSSTGGVHTIPTANNNGGGYNFGLGAQYKINDWVSLRADAKRYRVNDAVGNLGDIDVYSVSLVFPFGRESQPQPPEPKPVVMTPEPVASTPAPTPIMAAPVVVAPAPKPTRVTFLADSFFGFDQSKLMPEGKEQLDQFAQKLKGAQYSDISVTGYSDRIGAHHYNMLLSKRRAEAVKKYLVDVDGIDAAKITAMGKDGEDPATKPDQCVGNKITKQLIACLQPDRRVVVEVTGLQNP